VKFFKWIKILIEDERFKTGNETFFKREETFSKWRDENIFKVDEIFL